MTGSVHATSATGAAVPGGAITTGVLFHIGTDGNGNTGDVLDMTPATSTNSGWFDPSLVVGQSFQDPTANLTITPAAVNSGGASLPAAIA